MTLLDTVLFMAYFMLSAWYCLSYGRCGNERDLYKRQVDRLVAENVKLRELLRDMWRCERSDSDCHPCMEERGADDDERSCPYSTFRKRLAEYGVTG